MKLCLTKQGRQRYWRAPRPRPDPDLIGVNGEMWSRRYTISSQHCLQQKQEQLQKILHRPSWHCKLPCGLDLVLWMAGWCAALRPHSNTHNTGPIKVRTSPPKGPPGSTGVQAHCTCAGFGRCKCGRASPPFTGAIFSLRASQAPRRPRACHGELGCKKASTCQCDTPTRGGGRAGGGGICEHTFT